MGVRAAPPLQPKRLAPELPAARGMNFPMALTCILYGVSAEDIAAILNRVRLSRGGARAADRDPTSARYTQVATNAYAAELPCPGRVAWLPDDGDIACLPRCQSAIGSQISSATSTTRSGPG